MDYSGKEKESTVSCTDSVTLVAFSLSFCNKLGVLFTINSSHYPLIIELVQCFLLSKDTCSFFNRVDFSHLLSVVINVICSCGSSWKGSKRNELFQSVILITCKLLLGYRKSWSCFEKAASGIKTWATYCKIYIPCLQFEHDESANDGNRLVFTSFIYLFIHDESQIICSQSIRDIRLSAFDSFVHYLVCKRNKKERNQSEKIRKRKWWDVKWIKCVVWMDIIKKEIKGKFCLCLFTRMEESKQ